jgi:predicted flavoprotein YhiN
VRIIVEYAVEQIAILDEPISHVAADGRPFSATRPEGGAPGHSKTGKAASILWGISGGTVFSVVGFVVLTLYQQYNENLVDINKDLKHLNEVTAEHMKREEVRTRMTTLWNSLKDMTKEVQVAKTMNVSQEGRIIRLEERWKAAEEERRELVRELQRLRERLARVEGQQAVSSKVR